MKIDRPLQLTDELRSKLSKPIGELIAGTEENLGHAVGVIKRNIHPRGVSSLPPQGWKPIVTVGDVVAKSFNDGGLAMDIAVVDYQVKRVETFKNLSEIGFTKSEPDIVAKNPKGTLTPDSFAAVEKAILSLRGAQRRSNPVRDRHASLAMTTPYVIRVIGEEDLLTLAVILAAPLGTHVYYGQPSEGIVDVAITEEKKEEIRDIISRFAIDSI